MKKLFLLWIFAGVSFSCSDEEKPTIYPQPNTVFKRVTLEAEGQESVYEFEYDSQKRISKIICTNGFDGDYTMELSYDEQNRLSKRKLMEVGSSPRTITFKYNTQGQLSEVIDNAGDNMPFAYDASLDRYSVGLLDFSLDADGDITFLEGAMPAYTTGKKTGTTALAPNYGLLCVFNDEYLMYVISKKPMASMKFGNTTHSADHTFNDDGYVTSTLVHLYSANYEYQSIY